LYHRGVVVAHSRRRYIPTTYILTINALEIKSIHAAMFDNEYGGGTHEQITVTSQCIFIFPRPVTERGQG
jgi:hypothetical protein